MGVALTRRTGLKRDTPKAREFAGKRSRIAPRSTRRRDQEPERVDVRATVLDRAAGVCQYAEIVPEVECGFYPWADRPGLEVDELHGGAQRSIEWLDPEACRAVCPRHHDVKTDGIVIPGVGFIGKRAVLDRLAVFEGRADAV